MDRPCPIKSVLPHVVVANQALHGNTKVRGPGVLFLACTHSSPSPVFGLYPQLPKSCFWPVPTAPQVLFLACTHSSPSPVFGLYPQLPKSLFFWPILVAIHFLRFAKKERGSNNHSGFCSVFGLMWCCGVLLCRVAQVR